MCEKADFGIKGKFGSKIVTTPAHNYNKTKHQQQQQDQVVLISNPIALF